MRAIAREFHNINQRQITEKTGPRLAHEDRSTTWKQKGVYFLQLFSEFGGPLTFFFDAFFSCLYIFNLSSKYSEIVTTGSTVLGRRENLEYDFGSSSWLFRVQPYPRALPPRDLASVRLRFRGFQAGWECKQGEKLIHNNLLYVM